MFDTFILLAGQAEHVAMPPVLRAHNPQLSVLLVATSGDLANVEPDLLEQARLIAFVTPEIVSRSILEKFGYGAIPGWAPSHFALYQRATEFGATVHLMVEKLDAGPIVDVARYPVASGISVLGAGAARLCPPRAAVLAHGETACDRSEPAANACG